MKHVYPKLLLVISMLVSCVPAIEHLVTLGDLQNAPSYGYTPLDALPVTTVSCPGKPVDVLTLLPDETMRLSIAWASRSGDIKYGVATAGVADENYVVTLDYTKSDTVPLFASAPSTTSGKTTISLEQVADPQSTSSVPVYVGIGLRLTANVRIFKSGVNLANLFGLGAAGDAKELQGSLVIQTLGITGDSVSASLSIPTEISQASVQNAIQALASIRAKIYGGAATLHPRVTGLYNILGGIDATKNIVSFILKHPIKWPGNCDQTCSCEANQQGKNLDHLMLENYFPMSLPLQSRLMIPTLLTAAR